MEQSSKKKNTRTTINGYYIHDCRKAAKYSFTKFLIDVQLNKEDHCYDIFVRQTIRKNGVIEQVSGAEVEKFKDYFPKSFNLILLSEQQADLRCN